jgi:DNA-directed RNA polymerase specialized sigma24 family protein
VDAALVRAATLGIRERLAAGLRCAAGLTYAEIGEILGIRADAARAACRRAMQRVRPRRGRLR